MKLHMSWNEFLHFFPHLLPLLLPILILYLVLILMAVISLFKKKLPFSQIVIWFMIIVFCNLIGPVIYFAIGSKMLDEKMSNNEENKNECY